MIFAGAAMLAKFHWLIYVFGRSSSSPASSCSCSVASTTARTAVGRCAWPDASSRRARGWTETFFSVDAGRRVATPLFMALLLVEVTDVIFAVDSIPAIFAVTSDPFLVFTSNIFAILGLRSLFFLLAAWPISSAISRWPGRGPGVRRLKMAAVDVLKLPPLVSVVVIAAILATSVLVSIRATRREAELALARARPSCRRRCAASWAPARARATQPRVAPGGCRAVTRPPSARRCVMLVSLVAAASCA